MDKTPQIAEEKLVIYDNRKTQETKLQRYSTKVSVSLFSADISKSKEISRLRPINKTLHYDFSATKTFFKNHHNFLSEGLTFFPAMGIKKEAKRSILQDYEETDTHTHMAYAQLLHVYYL